MFMIISATESFQLAEGASNSIDLTTQSTWLKVRDAYMITLACRLAENETFQIYNYLYFED